MATPPALTQIAFANGIDESIEPEVLDPAAAFAVLVNGRQDRRGGYAKRLGFDFFENDRFDATTRTTGERLMDHDGPCVIDATPKMDRLDESKLLWQSLGRVPECSVSTRPLAIVDAESVIDLVHCNGYLTTAALVTDPSNSYIVVSVETVDGAVIRSTETMLTSTGILLASLATYSVYIVLFTVDPASANIAAYYLDTTSAATVTTGWVSLGNLATDKTTSGNGNRHCSTQSLTNRVAFAYVNDSGGASQITVKTATIAGVLETRAVNTSSVKPAVLSIEGSIADTLWVIWNETTACKVIGLDADSLATTLATTATVVTYSTAPTRVPHIQSSTTAGAGRLFAVDGDGLKTHIQSFTTSGGAVTPGTANTVPYGYLYNRPWLVAGRYYATAYAGNVTNTQKLGIIVDWTDALTEDWFRPVANPFPNLVNAVTTTGRGAVHPWIISATRVAAVLTVQRSSAATSAFLVTLDYADADRWQSTEHNGSLVLSGGVTAYSDRRRVAEVGFLQSLVTSIASTSGTGITGTFSYVSTVEEVDNAGNWCISGVSLPVSTGSVTDKTINVFTTPLAITSRRTATASGVDPRIRVRFWRTVTGGSPPYYLAGVASHVATGTTLADATSDAVLATGALLYGTGNLPGTNGAGQDRRAPPSSADVVSYNGMLVTAFRSDIFWSGQTVSGEGTWFSPAFSVALDGPGDITALSVLDGTLYVFKSDGVFAVSGDAPSDNGSAGGLGTPRRLSADVGCVSPRSVVATGLGIFFRSSRGIELLERSGAVSWVGEKVQETLAAYPTVTSAVLDARNSLVRIAVTDGEAGRTLIYDLTLRAWVSVDFIQGSLDEEASADAAQVTYADGTLRYTWLGADGFVWPERDSGDADAHLDGTEWFNREAETGSFKASGIQGRQFLNRLLVLARYATDHNLEVSLAYNYETSFRTARTWTRAEINALLSDGWPITQLRHDSHDDAECQSVRVRLVEKTPTGGTVGSGKGATWLALTLDLTPKPGAFDVPEGAV